MVYPAGAPFPDIPSQGEESEPSSGIVRMQETIRSVIASVSIGLDIGDVAFVGDSMEWFAQSELGVFNPYDPTDTGVNVWAEDNIHASKFGAYIGALALLGNIAGVNPLEVSTGPGSTAAVLGITPDVAAAMASRTVYFSPVRRVAA
jgi:anaerobic glycerol-3-phosphate dehydrogenase